ncbi:MAG: hypothetical protein KTR24_03720 [Saprospiraceae bacterium]|nr:hypothetical protein [Saprospiraceae bacterium]
MISVCHKTRVKPLPLHVPAPCIALGILCLLLLGSSCRPADAPLELEFDKVYQVRNFYNSAVELAKFDLTLDEWNEAKHPLLHLTEPGCMLSQRDRVLTFSNPTPYEQKSYASLGKLVNYAAIDLDIPVTPSSGSTHLSLCNNVENHFTVSSQFTDLHQLMIKLEGKAEGHCYLDTTFQHTLRDAPLTIRLHLTGKFINVLVVQAEEWTVLGSFDVSESVELRDKSILEKYSIYVGAQLKSNERAVISGATLYLTCGTAQADPRVIHYEDGTPMLKGDTLWVAMTTRGYGTQLYQGIYQCILGRQEWTVTGCLVFNKGDGLLRQWAASDVLYDRRSRNWKVFTVSHRDDHMLYAGQTEDDLRFGQTEIHCAPMQYPSVGNEEDPSVIWDAQEKKWRMVMCKATEGYQTILWESEQWNGNWQELATYEPTSSTGVLLQKVDGQYYVSLAAATPLARWRY